MLKKLVLISALAAISPTAFANTAPYIGASVGITANTSNGTVTGGGFRGVPFNLFAGYGGLMNQSLYLAGEIFGTAGTANISDSTQLKTSYAFGASFIPGLMLSDHTLAYLRAGALRADFPNSNSNMLTGGQFGFGLQTCLTQNLDLRGEYDYVAYQSASYRVAGSTSSVTPRADQFNLGLVYRFD